MVQKRFFNKIMVDPSVLVLSARGGAPLVVASIVIRRMSSSVKPPPRPPTRDHTRLRALVDDHVLFVRRMLTRAGVPSSELDDQVQQTFIVATTRLDDVQVGSERSFLYQVALNVAAHVRRNLARRREVMEDRMPERIEAFATPEHLASRKEMRQLLDVVVEGMSEPLCQVFKLFMFEGADMAEIAARLGVPRGTVASRLRRARVQFRKHAAAIDFAWDLGSAGDTQIEDPTTLGREKIGDLMRALLSAGTRPASSTSRRLGTLAILGLTERSPLPSDRPLPLKP
jgi:RNA polymerase sigma-70 factor (ECF subfamily)